ILQARKQVKGSYLYGIKVLNVNDGKEKLELVTQATPVRCFALAPDAKHVAMGGDNGKLTYWDLTNAKEELAISVEHLDWADALAFSAQGTHLAIAGRMEGTNDWWTIWDFKKKQRIESHLLEGSPTRCMQFSPDGKLLV